MGISTNQIDRAVVLAKEYGAKRLILFGSSVENPDMATDLDLACDGIDDWRLYEFAARLEDELYILVDIVPLRPPTRFSRYIESNGEILL